MCKLTYACEDEFEVKNRYTTFVVNLRDKTSGCDFWRVAGLPCKHACSWIVYKRANLEMFCDTAYTSKVYYLCYNNIIHLMHELDVKNKGSYAQIDPPILRVTG